MQEKGYRIVGHELVPLGNDESAEGGAEEGQLSLHAGWQAARHLTALVRYGFSAPVQTLARYGFLDGRYTIFDYGCGRGDDVRGLVENGLTAAGWDPYYAPDNPIHPADIVNLGFVINVIEDFDERLDALTRAWSLAEQLLVVSVMLANQNDPRGPALPRRRADPARHLPEVLHPGRDQGVHRSGPGRGADPGRARRALRLSG